MTGDGGTRVARVGAVSLGLLLLAAAPAAADVAGEQVQRAIRLGVEAIRTQKGADGTWTERQQPGGVTCLATLALLQAGERPDSDAVAAALDHVRRLADQHVYTTALKVMALARADAQRYKPEITASAQWLVSAQNTSGLWNYTPAGERFDHSNSQFALLGLHTAAQAGVAVPDTVWQRALRAVVQTQSDDGGWSYQARGPSYGSMTAAGVADLIILGNTLHQGQERGFQNGAAPNCGKYRASRPLVKGLQWLGRNFQAQSNPQRGNLHVYYWLYAAERCGILSGQRLYGSHDWYREGAEFLVRAQGAGGLWNGDVVETCFAVLFLAKGRQSLLVQKLQWSDDDAWDPDRHDLENLLSSIGDKLGEPVAWQSVRLDAPLEDWLAAPLLYIQGHTFPQLSDQQRAKLRAFVEQGGTLLAEACCGQAEFRAGFERFTAATFPESPLHVLGKDHAVYRLLHKLEPSGLKGVDLGCRTSVIYSPKDLSCLWEQASVPALSAEAFQLGANIAAYAVGRRPLRDRLDAIVLPKSAETRPGPPPQDAFRLAQVVYDGDWRPFPVALVRLAEYLRDELDFDVVTQYRTLRLTDQDLHACPVLYLAGHYEFELSEPERAALAEHLRRGGFLIADACCGTDPFGGAVQRLLERMFPDATLERLPADHPILVGQPGFDARRVRYSADVSRAKPALDDAELWGLRIEGRLALVYSPYSLGCGLSGPAFDGCWGLASEDAKRLAANIVLYALTH